MNTLLILLTAFWQSVFPFPGPVGGPTVRIVNQSTCDTGANTTHNCTITAPASGNILVMLGGTDVIFANGLAGGGTAFSQANVAWTAITNGDVNLSNATIYCGDVSASASTTVVVTRTGSTGRFLITFVEVGGSKSCSNFNGFLAGGNSGTSDNGGFNTTVLTQTKTVNVTSDAMFFAVFGQQHGNASTVSGLTNGFLALSTASNTITPSYRYVTSASGSFSTAWTLNAADNWDSAISGIAKQ